MKAPTRIYIRLPNWIGDVCMSLPSLYATMATNCEVVVCAKSWASSLLEGVSNVRFIAFSGRWTEDYKLIKKDLKDHPCDSAVGLLLPDSLSSCLSFRVAGLPSGGYKDDGRSLLLKWPINKPQPRRHAVKQWYYLTHMVLQRWGFDSPVSPPDSLSLNISEQSKAKAKQFMQTNGLSENKFVVIAPTATGTHKGKNKVWPHFEALTQDLQAKNIRVVMSVPPNEQAQARQNAPSAELLDPLDLGSFIAFLDQAAMVICNDSGVSHLTTLTDSTLITLIGVTNPQHTGPWSPQAHIIGQEGQWPSVHEVIHEINRFKF